jgi:hypothetical protein
MTLSISFIAVFIILFREYHVYSHSLTTCHTRFKNNLGIQQSIWKWSGWCWMKASWWGIMLLKKTRKSYYFLFIKTVKQVLEIFIVTLNVTRDKNLAWHQDLKYFTIEAKKSYFCTLHTSLIHTNTILCLLICAESSYSAIKKIIYASHLKHIMSHHEYTA